MPRASPQPARRPKVRTPVIRHEAVSLGELFQRSHFEISDEDIREGVIESLEGDALWDEHTLRLCEISCAFMAQEVLTGPPEAPYHGRFLISEHHEEWNELVSEYDRLCILAARDHGKTFFFDFAYPIWKVLTQPHGNGFIFSSTQPQASRILDDIKAEIEGNPRLSYLVPGRKAGTKWSATSIQLTNGHRIYARGFGTRVRGAHPHWIIVDDGLNDETAYSETVRKKQIEYFYTAITNMIRPGGQIVVVGTPFAQNDLYADLKENPEYEFRRYPALQGKDEVPLWPERYSKERLLKRRSEIGVVRFTREFGCLPVADDMSLFPLHLFKGDPTEQMMIKLGMPKNFWEKAGVQIFMGADFAMSSSVQADYTVVWVMGVDKAGNRWIIDIHRAKGMPYQEQLSLINTLGRKYDPGLIFLEANQMQRIFGDELIRKTDLPIKKFTTTAQNKNALDKGVPSLRVLLENKKVRIPRGDAHSVEVTDIWINEMRAFTWNDGKLQGVGTHDDCPMAFWICDQAIRQGSFTYSFGEEDDSPSGSLDDMLHADNAEPEDEGGGSNGPDPADGKDEVTANLIDEELLRGGAPLAKELGRWRY